MDPIPFGKPFIAGKELYYIAQAVLSGSIAGNGLFTRQCHQWLEQHLGCGWALLTHSGTAALEMAAILCDIQPGDEVIMPSFTFVSTANAFVLRGGVPVFVDIRNDTLNMDESLIEAAITDRTKAIVPVHYAGTACAMDQILEVAEHHNLWVVEDAAQAFLAKHGEHYLGSLGHLGCLSFHETKNIISGEGGALLINDERLKERAEVVWEKGTNRRQFLRGQVDKYTWTDIGSSFLPSELIGAFLYGQLEHAEAITEARQRIFASYLELLSPLENKGLVRLPHCGESSSNGHIFYVITRSLTERSDLIRYLKDRGILAVFHFVPLHSSPAGMRYGRVGGTMIVTDSNSERLVRLPLYYEMRDEDVERVGSAVKAFYLNR